MRIPKLPCRGKICLLVSMSRVGVVLRNLSLKLSTSLKKVNISSATSFNHSLGKYFSKMRYSMRNLHCRDTTGKYFPLFEVINCTYFLEGSTNLEYLKLHQLTGQR